MEAKPKNKRKKGAHVVRKSASATAPKPQKSKEKRRVPRGVIVMLCVLAAFVIALGGFNLLYPYIFPGVSAGSIAVGGKPMDAAAQLIGEQSDALYEDAVVSVSIYEQTYDIPVAQVIGSVDSEQSAKNAYAVGRTGNPFQCLWQMLLAFAGQSDAQLAVIVDEDSLTQTLSDIAAEALTEPVEPTWDIGTDKMTIYAGKPGVHFDTEAVEQALAEKIRLMDFTAYEVSTELTETPAIDIDKIAETVIGDPVNATVDKTDGTTILPEKPGVQFDVDEARTIIGDGSAESYEIPITMTAAAVSAADLQEKLFRDTLARTSTSLNEGNVSRTNNVRLAAASINGTILNPGEEFSYNTVVGERTAARGYQSAGAYSGGKVIDEVGGGVCQPSSTLYMAVLRADLEVTERHNHSFTVSYTPLGEDATVDYPSGTDFRFKNNTNYPVKILAEQSDGEMIMTLLGTKTSDKTVTTRTEVIETYSPQTIEKKDDSMKAGQTRVEETGITGYATRTYKQITVNGETTEVLANTSNYNKRDQTVYVGTIQPQAETPAEGDAGTTPTDESTEANGSADPETE